MSLVTRKRTILAKIEGTYGTDPTPTGGANAILVRNMSITPIESEQESRDLIRPFLGASDVLLAHVGVAIEFEVELAGSGAAGTAPAWGPLLKACGFGETIVAVTSVTYAPLSSAMPSVTIYHNIDGVLHKLTGCRGTVEFDLNVKKIPVMKFKFMGIYNAPTDTAAPTVDYTAFQIPKVVNTANTTAFSLFSYSGFLESVSLNMSNQVEHRVLVGRESVEIIDRKPAGTFVIEAPTIAAKDFFAIAKAGTTGALSVQHGATAGNIVTIAAPRVSLGDVQYQDSQGVQMLSLPFVASPSSGNDEVSIALT